MIEVFIVDDHFMVVEGIRALLSGEPDIDFIGSASGIMSCKAFLKNKQPDVLLLDINLPDGNGIDLCKEIKKEYPALHILGLSTFNQGSYINDMMQHGASGYVLKNASQKELCDAIRTAASGKIYLAFDVAQTLKESRKNSTENIIIGKREKEVLQLISRGFTNPEIADALNISIHTVDTYRKSLLYKFDAKNTADLVRLAFEHGFIEKEK